MFDPLTELALAKSETFDWTRFCRQLLDTAGEKPWGAALPILHDVIERDRRGAAAFGHAFIVTATPPVRDDALSHAAFIGLLAAIDEAEGDHNNATELARRAIGLLEQMPDSDEKPEKLDAWKLLAQLKGGNFSQSESEALSDVQAAVDAASSIDPASVLTPKGQILSSFAPVAAKGRWVRAVVLFATNRQRSSIAYGDRERAFGHEIARATTFGKAELDVREDLDITAIREALSPLQARISKLRRSSGTNTELVRIHTLDKSTFFNELKSTPTKEILIYVHGYNVSFGRSLCIGAQLGVALDIQGPTIAVSWPSRGSGMPWDYLADERTVGSIAGDDFADIVGRIMEDPELRDARVYVIAHSMGNRVLLKTIQCFDKRSPAVEKRIDSVVLASPDVERKAFEQQMAAVRRVAKRITLYSSEKDIALQIAEHLSGSPGLRAGCGLPPLVLEGVETIETSNASGDMVGHSDFDGTGRDDLRTLLWHDTPLQRRDMIALSGSGNYHEFQKVEAIEAYLLNCRKAVILARVAGKEEALRELDRRVNSLSIRAATDRKELLDIGRFVSRVCGDGAQSN